MTQKIFNGLLVLAFSFFSTFTTMAFAGSALVDEKILTVKSLSSEIDLQNAEAIYGLSCTYRSGIFMPQTKSCGYSTVTLKIESDGTIRLPALSKLSGLHGAKIENYKVSLIVQPKNKDPRNQRYYFTLDARGKEGLENFAAFRETIYVVNLAGGDFDVTAERKPLIGGELSQNPNSQLFVTVGLQGGTLNLPSVILVSNFSMNLTSYENRIAPNGIKEYNKDDLKKLKKVHIEGGNLAFVGNPNDRKIALTVWYGQGQFTSVKLFEKTLESKIDENFLKDIDVVDLQKVK
jgi:hypothetical protein